MACFRSEEDQLVYLALLRQVPSVKVHAYCLMPNHVHLLLTPTKADACSALMKSVSHRYAHYFNRKYARTGTLWEGRYRSCLVETGHYVLACYRYIELNPVRAGLVSTPALYPWSSYAVNAGLGRDPLIAPHPEYTSIGTPAYIALVSDGLESSLVREIREATSGGYPFATEAFKERLKSVTTRRLRRVPPGPKARERPENSSVPDPDLFGKIGA